MKLIVDIPEEVYSFVIKTGLERSPKITDAIRSGISIPDNATNGDVIKALYPNKQFYIVFDKVKGLYEPSRTLDNPSLDLEWWNAPYEGSDTE